MNHTIHILSANWLTRFHGVAELSQDWLGDAMPPLALEAPGKIFRISRVESRRWARYSSYYFDEQGRAVFLLCPELYPDLDWRNEEVLVAGDFNGWTPGSEWALRPETIEGETVLTIPAPVPLDSGVFKFVTRTGHWLEPHVHAHNRVRDASGNYNFVLNSARTGRHVFSFVTKAPASLAARSRLFWACADNPHSVPVADDIYLLYQDTALELGAHVRNGTTTFRIFAPRATAVTLVLASPRNPEERTRIPLGATGDGAWETRREGSLHGWRYFYHVEGENADDSTDFDKTAPVLDPWALAALGPAGPGIVVDTATLAMPARQYHPPALADAVIVEAHLRDLLARVPRTGGAQPAGFRELAAWVRSPDCYLRRLGANVLELLPVHEYESADRSEYHWGYMPVNWFAPASAYASDPAAASHLGDLQDLVAACHEAGIAVVLDVVYNHTGTPNSLMRLDKTYFFETTPYDGLSNWSGCGNDLRATAPVARRLVLESLRHLVEYCDVDGFRFDLAELLGVPLLREIARELRPIKPGLLLIAEPWSFRGNISHVLKHSSYAAWNDGFREFLPAYVHGEGDAAGLAYFLSGSPSAPGVSPQRTLNYTESHDDFCWLDRITENPGNNGAAPTPTDARRTRLMAAILFASLGVPMLAAGQDFLRSKNGERNTYQRGDLNALDYVRLERFRDTHDYFRAWLAFRLSVAGATFRLRERPHDGFFRFFYAETTNALAALYNADGRLAVRTQLLAVNPHSTPVEIPVPNVESIRFRQLATSDRFCATGLPPGECYEFRNGAIRLPALSIGLWIAG